MYRAAKFRLYNCVFFHRKARKINTIVQIAAIKKYTFGQKARTIGQIPGGLKEFSQIFSGISEDFPAISPNFPKDPREFSRNFPPGSGAGSGAF